MWQNNKTNDMQKKSILMPHACQKIGWCLLIIAILADVIKTLFFRDLASMETAGSIARASSILLLISLFFICLSKEKVEDEMISSLRLNAVGITAYVFILSFLLHSLFSVVSDYFFPAFEPNPFVYELAFLCLPILTIGLYYVIFRGMLWRSRKEEAL